jgi:hypothetical protein
VLELAGTGHVRAAAQVLEIAFAVQTDVLVGWNAGNDFGLVMLTQTLEISHRLIAWQNAAHHRLVLVGQLGHALFNGHQVFWREGAAVGKVVIKTVVDHRTDGDLRLGEQLLDGISQQVRGRVAYQFQAFRVFGRHNSQLGIGAHAETGVHQLTIDFATQGRFGQACTNGCGHLGHGHGAWKFTQ